MLASAQRQMAQSLALRQLMASWGSNQLWD